MASAECAFGGLCGSPPLVECKLRPRGFIRTIIAPYFQLDTLSNTGLKRLNPALMTRATPCMPACFMPSPTGRAFRAIQFERACGKKAASRLRRRFCEHGSEWRCGRRRGGGYEWRIAIFENIYRFWRK